MECDGHDFKHFEVGKSVTQFIMVQLGYLPWVAAIDEGAR